MASGHDLALKALQSFRPRNDYTKHHPKISCTCCPDARLGAGEFLGVGEETFRPTLFGGLFANPKTPSDDCDATIGFILEKGIEVLLITGHTECGAAQTIMAHPDYTQAPNRNIKRIVKKMAAGGEDLVALRDSLLRACEGNKEVATDMLARHMVVCGLRNFSNDPDVDAKIQKRELHALPLFLILNTDTGLYSQLERYDVSEKRWIDVQDPTADLIVNMCNRPNDCNDCNTCEDTISESLQLAPVEVADENGQIEYVDVPRHIKILLEERRAEFQPKTLEILSKEKKPRRTIQLVQTEPNNLGL